MEVNSWQDILPGRCQRWEEPSATAMWFAAPPVSQQKTRRSLFLLRSAAFELAEFMRTSDGAQSDARGVNCHIFLPFELAAETIDQFFKNDSQSEMRDFCWSCCLHVKSTWCAIQAGLAWFACYRAMNLWRVKLNYFFTTCSTLCCSIFSLSGCRRLGERRETNLAFFDAQNPVPGCFLTQICCL